MTTLTVVLIAAAGVAAIVGLVVAVLVIEARAIERACDRFDLTDDDAPRDDSDFPPDDPQAFEAWMRKKYGLTP